MINKNKNPRAELLKSYIHRLNEGESLESVRKDFVEAFEMVEASEIAIAEQEMIQDGMPISEVQNYAIFTLPSSMDYVKNRLPMPTKRPSVFC